MKRFFKLFGLGFLITGLTGCISFSEQVTPEAVKYYTQPTISKNIATIIGSIEKSQSIKADKISYVFAIDHQKIPNGRAQLSIPQNITAGEHDLQIWCQRGGYKYTNLVKVNFETNKNYQIGFEMNVNNQNNCFFWIYDLETKQALGELVQGIEVGEYTDPNKVRPLLYRLEPQSVTKQNLNIPIRVINKMGHN
ncbi:hypothetical protein [Acinetobacter proteolyticus]|uniref:Lipoprotein n=1 Tax=Acinetobacter proteolyticus TaxID=1776741 RepID=A0A2N0WAX3_9GAMM|nr:hypothetical protein [Acinetobacter proteolyticus]PKF31649.1 hypothetical protein CW311_18115 [Acinetobacter proteolyticus]